MLDVENTRAQMRRLSTIHQALSSARTFEAYVDTIQRDMRLHDEDVAAGVDQLMAATDDTRLTPGRVIDYALRHRAQRLAQHRAAQADSDGPSVVPAYGTCRKCAGPLVILVMERKRYCQTCNSIGVHELDALTVDAEVRLFTEARQQRMAEAA